MDENGNGVSRRQRPDWPDPVSSAGDRMQLIVEAANCVAAEVREEAEAQARHYVEDARRRAEALTSERVRFIHETSNSLLEQGRMVMAHTDELVQALHDAADRIGAAASSVGERREPGREPGNPEPPERESPVSREWSPAGTSRAAEPRPRDPEPAETDEGPSAAAPQSGGGTSDVHRLLATKMAVAGSSRAQVEARLRGIGVEDPVGIVDAAFKDV
jgi:ElaB/YqjD/DUF883 family membrane-anchored ribosome-binding protein